MNLPLVGRALVVQSVEHDTWPKYINPLFNYIGSLEVNFQTCQFDYQQGDTEFTVFFTHRDNHIKTQ